MTDDSQEGNLRTDPGLPPMAEPQLSDVPVGALLPYAGGMKDLQLEAVGWLIADGQEIYMAEYPELYAAVGTTFGSSGNGTFRLPKVPPMELINADGDGFEARYLIRAMSERHLGSTAADA